MHKASTINDGRKDFSVLRGKQGAALGLKSIFGKNSVTNERFILLLEQ